MSTIQDKIVLITGASSGIGEATARLLAQNGAHVILGARRTDRLESLVEEIRSKNGSAEYSSLDVTKQDQMETFIANAKKKHGRIDVIVNNAGIMPVSALDVLKVEEWDAMIDVNIRGVLYSIAAGLPIMEEQEGGHFITIASVGAYNVVPGAVVYCATKFAVKAITDGLRMEAGSKHNIRVTLVSPGVTESELADSISDKEAKQAMIDYRRNSIPAGAIAQSILYAIDQPEDVAVNELIVEPTANSN